LSDRQIQVRDSLLDEGESYVAFAREGVIANKDGQLIASRAWDGFVKFCVDRGWTPVSERVFFTGFKLAVADIYGLSCSHSLIGEYGTVRGWHGLSLLSL
jgi:hypothetical protein